MAVIKNRLKSSQIALPYDDLLPVIIKQASIEKDTTYEYSY